MYKSDRINRWFAASSVLMALSIFWMIKVDYDRPWRNVQDRFYVGKAAVAHFDYLNAVREDRRNEIEDAERRLADAREFVEQTESARIAELRSQLEHADLEFRKANGPYSRASQVMDVTKDTYEKALGRFGPDHPETVNAHEQLLSEEDEVDRLRKIKEKWEDETSQIEREIRAIEDRVRSAESRVNELRLTAESALEKDQAFRGVLTDDGLFGGLPIVSTLINLPLLDFTAPKNTPARHQINQLVLPEVHQRLNYLETYTTDRCTTCHVAANDPEFARDVLAMKLESSLPGINEALQRMGEQPMDPPAPPVVASSGETLPAGRVTDFWNLLTRDQQDGYFEVLLGQVNNYLEQSGRKTIELGEPVLAHPHLDLFVSIDSAHPMSRMGCTVCHEGNPQETDFVQAAHSPRTHEIEKEWAEKYYITSGGIPNVTFYTISHYWDRPMRLPEHTEASCAKCHEQISDIARFEGQRVGSQINLGQHLFREVGCINCHNVDDLAGSRRVGPELTSLAQKLDPEFVQQWMWYPQKFKPSTRMPHLFLQENSLADSANQFDPDPVLRTKTEAAAMSAYLFAVSQQWEPIRPPDGVEGDVERGRQLFRTVGCLACHSNLAEFGEEWITRDLVHREGINSDVALYRYKAMSQEDRIRYAMEHFESHDDTFLAPEEVTFDPGADYHRPVFSRFAPELSGIGSKVDADWLYSWLMDPSYYSPETKMPSLRLTPEEAADLTAYLMTLKNDEFVQEKFALDKAATDMADGLVFTLLSALRSERRSRAIMEDENDELTNMLVSMLEKSRAIGGKKAAQDLIGAMSKEEKRLAYLGNKMIGHYGCYACHKIPGFEDTTPPGTDLTLWAEKPITQLDFAFFDYAFHDMHEKKDEVFGFVYRPEHKDLNDRSPLPERTREQITHTHAGFAKHKMLNPRIWDREKIKKPYDKLKMPNYYFTEAEADALTTYMLSRIPPRVADSLKVDYENDLRGPIAKGRTLTRELNCIGCHQIEDNAPIVHQHFRREIAGRLVFDITNAPPLLWGQGAKVQHNWMHRFLHQVEPLRPWLQIRMPSYDLTDEQATTLVEYFAALSQDDSQQLTEWMTQVKEHRRSEASRELGIPIADVTEEQLREFAKDWFQQDSFRRHAANLSRWAVERQLVREGDVDPLALEPDRLERGFEQVWERTEFLKQLYDVEYPFVQPPSPLSPEPRYELGFSFIKDMGCLQCHVLGPMLPGPAETTNDFVQVFRLDAVRGEGSQAVAVLNGKPYPVGSVIDGHTLISAEDLIHGSGDRETKAIVEGPGPSGDLERILLVAPSAPNLGLTYERLRPRWVHDWMLNPQLIQPGTKMPQNFGGGRSPFEDDPKYPGEGEDHIQLLVDFMYDAGAKRDRAPLPKLMAPSEDEAFEEDDFFED